ncbi:hypothetical protein GCM10010390_78230 [Streptomyces mordarskii]|uniref:Uncharacterized protein n=1 Tax=Streptomyces mordarskii TaxID=1226758 RepID=A0ABP3PF78_9ACTN
MDAPIHVVHPPHRRGDGREDPLRLLVEPLPGIGQLHTAGAPYQQSALHLLLEGPDLAAEDRLGDIELFRRTAEVPVLGHRDEVAELAQIEIHALKVSIAGKGIGRPQVAAPRLKT